MEFDKSRVYTAVNADELKVGSKVICANNMDDLNLKIHEITDEYLEIRAIGSWDTGYRFITTDGNDWLLCYLISEPEEKKLKWTDLKVKDVIKRGKEQAEVTYINEEGIDGKKNIHLWVGFIGVIRDEELGEWEKVEK